MIRKVKVVVWGQLRQVHAVYSEGRYDDGEHVDKSVKFTGLSVYVRKYARRTVAGSEDKPHPVDASTQEYILRPVDFNFSFSLFAVSIRAPKRCFAKRRRRRWFDDRTAATITENPSGGDSSSSSYISAAGGSVTRRL
jgi:hypothetical protein